MGHPGPYSVAGTVAVRRGRARRWTALLSVLSLLVAGLVGIGSTTPAPAAAADLSQFRPGNIISDQRFFDSGTMTAPQIQAFMQEKSPVCQTGYTCLKDWYDTSRTTAADAMCGAYSGGIRERASTIIYKVARACGINPQVILVMLQKEQGLVTHTWPSEWRYTIAMGQGCPDTAACDTRYYGFFNQVYGAAWQLKRYANPPGTSQFFTWYAPGKTWNILWNPNHGCGSAPVYVENQATANLYYYTPYQPNAAALRAGYGEGDGCSSYGNRNFFNYLHDWFTAPPPRPVMTSIDEVQHTVALDRQGSLWAYPMSSGGLWGTAVRTGSGLSGFTQAFPVGDLDGDGHRDVVGVDAQKRGWLLPGDGSVGYRERRALGVDWSDARLITAAGDFNGDRIPDVFTVDAAGRLLLWPGSDSGGLRAPVQVGNGWGSFDLLSGGEDLTGDGIADLLARDSAGNLWVYPATGSGTWRSPVRIGYGWSGMSSIFVAGDFTGDGVADVMARDADGQLWRYQGRGAAFLGGKLLVGRGWQGMSSVTGGGPQAGGIRALAPGAGDMNADGAPDVVGLSHEGDVVLYRGDGNGGWGQTSVLRSGWSAQDRFVTLGDFDGDGGRDLARITPDGSFNLVRFDARGGFLEERRIGNGWQGVELIIGGIDFDGDRRPDVLGRAANGDLVLYRGNGAGGWVSGPTSVVGNGWGSIDAATYVGDFDGAGGGDVIARRSSDGSLWLYPTTGTGRWGTPKQIGQGWSGMTAIFGPGNFDGQRGPDLLARNGAGQLVLYRGDGRGGWAGTAVVGWGWGIFQQIG